MVFRSTKVIPLVGLLLIVLSVTDAFYVTTPRKAFVRGFDSNGCWYSNKKKSQRSLLSYSSEQLEQKQKPQASQPDILPRYQNNYDLGSAGESKISGVSRSSNERGSSKGGSWYPVRIQEVIDYDKAVRRLYLRHIVTQTKAMATVIVQSYLNATVQPTDGFSFDPFGALAQSVSDCAFTRSDNGRIGWVDNLSVSSTEPMALKEITSVMSETVVRQLFQLQPKSGDVHIVHDPTQSRYHIVQVTEVWMDPDYILSQTGNIVRKKNSANNANIAKMELAASNWPLTTSSALQTYDLQTFGCQMNVADSERLEGILRLDWNMTRIQQPPAPLPPQLVRSDLMDSLDTKVINVKTSSRKEKSRAARATRATVLRPDLLVINTCSIRDGAEQKLYNALRPFLASSSVVGNHAKNQSKRNQRSGHNLDTNEEHVEAAVAALQPKKTAIIVTGCVAQQEGERLLERIPGIDAVIGPQYIPYLSRILEHIESGGNQLVLTAPIFIQQHQPSPRPSFLPQRDLTSTTTIATTSTSNSFDTMAGLYTKPLRGHDIRAWVNVINGCNEHCTYCVVPSTRGMEQSRSMESILEECNQLGGKNGPNGPNGSGGGYREITLLGQNIDAYGRDMVPRRSFAQLLRHLNDNIDRSSIVRIRYVTSHPRYFSDRVIDAVVNCDRVCECFHMPFQAGDDEVLKRMRRGYTNQSYRAIVDRIRAVAGTDAAITTDIIVGFPGETDEQFEKTLQLMDYVRFDMVYSFIYSPRPNTDAAHYDDVESVSMDVKRERLQRVQQLAAVHGQERSNRYLNRIVEVLVEDTNPKAPLTQVMGRTRQGRPVYFDGDYEQLKGQLIDVYITQAGPWSLIGQRGV